MTTTKKRRRHRPKAKTQIEFPALCAIVRRILIRLPTIDNIYLKETVKQYVLSNGFQCLDSATVYRAVDAMENAYPTLRQEPPITMPAPSVIEERPDPTQIPRPWTKERAGPQTMTPIGELLQSVSTFARSSTNSKRG